MNAQLGSPAPDFTLPNQKNEPVRLSDYVGKKVIVLYFYPKDNSAGCTAQACAFRDSYEDFKDAGAEVIGVSGGTLYEKEAFIEKNRLPFVLLNDENWKVNELYGVKKTLGIVRERKTFVIDRQGVIQHIFSSQMNINKHIQEAKEIVKRLASAPVT